MLITGGGTAGHVTPLLAVAAELKRQQTKSVIRFVGQRGDPMQKLISGSSDINKVYRIYAGKWRRYHGLGWYNHLRDYRTVFKNIRDSFLAIIGFLQSLVILIDWRPDVVFVKGGFVGLPVGLAAVLLRVSIVTHDSDCVPGLTNKLLSRFAKALAVGMPPESYTKYYPLVKMYFTGVPIKSEFYRIDQSKSKKQLSIPENNKVILVIGGSLGAVRLNEAIYANLNKIFELPNWYLLWVSGDFQYSDLKQRLNNYSHQDKICLVNFSNKMPELIGASDIVISRAGATSIAELAAAAKSTILVPNPILAGGHQLINAAFLVKHQAVHVVTEQELSNRPDLLGIAINSMQSSTEARQRLGSNLHKLAVGDSAARIVKVIKMVVNHETILSTK